ncbi:MAG: 1-acyl-sn-glycerol-3-phosphate acyltransferase [Polyangiaceae bacterium]
MKRERLEDRLHRLDLPFDEYGVDPYGISKKHLLWACRALEPFYRRYFSVGVHGIHHVPAHGRAMLIGNHSGGVALDGAMVIASMFFDMDPPRLAQSMIEKFLSSLPFASIWTSRCGQFVGLPEHAERMLLDDRLLLVFPEGARGTAKLWKDRHSLVDFGTGFMRLALKTKSPIVPFGFLGGGDAVPTVANLYGIGKLLGVPYVPVTPWIAPLPLPVKLDVYYGEPMMFEGTGAEDDETIFGYVERVKAEIAGLIERGRRERKGEA